MENTPESQVLLDVANANKLHEFNNRKFLLAPSGYKLHDLHDMQAYPSRKKGEKGLLDADSFISYFNRHKTKETTCLYVEPERTLFLAVFNDHEEATGENAGWRDFTAGYMCQQSTEKVIWWGNNGKAMEQGDFATFIEDNLPDIVQPADIDGAPSSADMLEVSRELQAKNEINFKKAIRLDNGQNQIQYEETIQGSARNGQMQVPDRFYLGIPLFKNGVVYTVEARLRYRIKEGLLLMWYDLYRADRVFDQALENMIQYIEEHTGATALLARI